MFGTTEAKDSKQRKVCINCSIYMIILSITASIFVLLFLVWLRLKNNNGKCCNSEINKDESSSSSDSEDHYTRDFDDEKEEKILSDSLNAYIQSSRRYTALSRK